MYTQLTTTPNTILSVAFLSQSYTATILPVLASLCSRQASISTVSVFLPYAIELLTLYRTHHAKSTSEPHRVLDTWFSEQMKWVSKVSV